MTTILYGIPNCDTVKKARAWLTRHGVEHVFHDYRKTGVDPKLLKQWVDQAGIETLFNRNSLTFKGLPDADKEKLTEAKARKLMIAHPSLIKRPVLEKDGRVFIGFKPDEYAVIFGT